MRLIQGGMDGIKKKGFVNEFIRKNNAAYQDIVDIKQTANDKLHYDNIVNKPQELAQIAPRDTVIYEHNCCWFIAVYIFYVFAILFTKFKYTNHLKGIDEKSSELHLNKTTTNHTNIVNDNHELQECVFFFFKNIN